MTTKKRASRPKPQRETDDTRGAGQGRPRDWLLPSSVYDPDARKKFFQPATREISEEAVAQEEILADLAAFQEFRETIAPVLRAMVEKRTPPKQMYAEFESALAARALSIALTSRDPGKAFAAVKDILDRTLGKATENKVVEHKLASLKDEQLDSLLESKLRDSGKIEILEDITEDESDE